MPDLTVFKRYKSIINNWGAFCDALTRPLPATIWSNPLRITPAYLADLLASEGIPCERIPWLPGGFQLPLDFKPGRHWAYLAGLYQTQEAVAAAPVMLLDPQPGERVLDMCAAPGNKTAQIAVKMQNTGTVVANDVNFGRMRAARQILERLGLVNVSTTIYNGAIYPNAAGMFDRVLVDAPCSCEGTSRKDPGVLERIGPEVSARTAGLQKDLLKRAVRLCKPGGRIVYATCTYAPEENEMVVDAALHEFPPGALRLAPARLDGFTASPGLTRWNGHTLHPSLVNAMRVWPHQNDTGGFFIAVIDKLADTSVPRRSQNEATPPLPDFPPLADSLLDQLAGRFGLSPAVFSPYRLFQPSRKRAYLTCPDHRPPRLPAPDAVGMLFMNTGIRFPKLSTAAALMFGQAASKNFIELIPNQLDAYLSCQQIPVSAEQTRACTGLGYVIVRFRGFSLGLGLFYPDGNGGTVQSQFPKGWSPTKGRPLKHGG